MGMTTQRSIQIRHRVTLNKKYDPLAAFSTFVMSAALVPTTILAASTVTTPALPSSRVIPAGEKAAG
jgi:hypothetical protein